MPVMLGIQDAPVPGLQKQQITAYPSVDVVRASDVHTRDGKVPSRFIVTELIDNALEAHLGVAGPRFIEVDYRLDQVSKIFVLDNACGMDESALARMASMNKRPDVNLAELDRRSSRVPYFADGRLGRFGAGSKKACRHLGITQTVYSMVKGGLIHKVTLDQDAMKAQERTEGHGWHLPSARGTLAQHLHELDCKATAEKLIKLQDQGQGTLVVVGGLHDERLVELREGFDKLVRPLTTSYFYYLSKGALIPDGYKPDIGDIDIMINGTGFQTDPTRQFSWRLNNLPASWPAAPLPEAADGLFEDPLTRLYRIIRTHGTFADATAPVYSSLRDPITSTFSVHYLNPVLGQLQVQLHYMPCVDGRETRLELESVGLEAGVQFWSFFKGRHVPYGGIQTLLPFMAKPSATGLPAPALQRVFGCIFLPGTAKVDEQKHSFKEDIAKELTKSPVYDLYYQGLASTGEDEPATRLMSTRFIEWCMACHVQFDRQVELFDCMTTSPTEQTLYRKAIYGRPRVASAPAAVQLPVAQHTELAAGEYVQAHLSAAISTYSSAKNSTVLLGKVAGFIADNKARGPQADLTSHTAFVLVTREPADIYRAEHRHGDGVWEVPIHELQHIIKGTKKLTRGRAGALMDEARLQCPSAVKMLFVGEETAQAQKPTAIRADGPLPTVVLAVVNARRMLMHDWTAARPAQPSKVNAFTVVQNIARVDAPDEIVATATCTAQLDVQDMPGLADVLRLSNIVLGNAAVAARGGQKAFIFNKDATRHKLPAGAYTVKYELQHPFPGIQVTPATLSLVVEPGAADVVELLADLQPVRLGQEIDVVVAIRDAPGGNSVRVQLKETDIKLTSATGQISLQLREHSWRTTAGAGRVPAQPLLHLRVQVSKAADIVQLPFGHSQAALACEVSLQLRCSEDKVLALPLTMTVQPGVATGLSLLTACDQVVLAATAADKQPAPMQNRSSLPDLSLQLVDQDGHPTVPDKDRVARVKLAEKDSGITVSATLSPFNAAGMAVVQQAHIYCKRLGEAPRLVKLQADGGLGLAPLALHALLVRSTRPDQVELYRDGALLMPTAPSKAKGTITYRIPQQAGEPVTGVQILVRSEAGTLPIRRVQLAVQDSAKAAVADPVTTDHDGSEKGLLNLGWLRAANTTTDSVKECQVVILADGKEDITLKLQVAAVHGPPLFYCIREAPTAARRGAAAGPPTLINGVLERSLVEVGAVDAFGNTVTSWAGYTAEMKPTIKASSVESPGAQAGSRVVFVHKDRQTDQYAGSFEIRADGWAPLKDLALMGPAGLIRFHASSTSNRIQSSDANPRTQTCFRLAAGATVASVQLAIPDTETVPLRGIFSAPTVLLLRDVGGNEMPARPEHRLLLKPSAGLRFQPVAGSNAPLYAVVGGRLCVQPFLFVAAAPGRYTIGVDVGTAARPAMCSVQMVLEARGAPNVVGGVRLAKGVPQPQPMMAGSICPDLRLEVVRQNGLPPKSLAKIGDFMSLVLQQPNKSALPVELRASVDSAYAVMKDPLCTSGTYKLVAHAKRDYILEGEADFDELPVCEVEVVPELVHGFAVASSEPAALGTLFGGNASDEELLGSITLQLVDWYNNVVHAALEGPCTVMICPAEGRDPATSSLPRLEGACTAHVARNGSVVFEHLQIKPMSGQGAHSPMLLVFSHPQVPNAFKVPFEFTDDASLREALRRVQECQQVLADCAAAAASADSALADARQATVLAAAQLLAVEREADLVDGNYDIQRLISGAKAEVTDMVHKGNHHVPALHQGAQLTRHILAGKPEYASHIKGVLADMFAIQDKALERVLVLAADTPKSRLNTIICDTEDAAYELRCDEAAIKDLQTCKDDNVWDWTLPHGSEQVDGNPEYAAHLVMPYGPLLDLPKADQNKLHAWLFGKTLIMDTLASARAYQARLLGMGQEYPSIGLRDQHELLAGSEDGTKGGPGSKASATGLLTSSFHFLEPEYLFRVHRTRLLRDVWAAERAHAAVVAREAAAAEQARAAQVALKDAAAALAAAEAELAMIRARISPPASGPLRDGSQASPKPGTPATPSLKTRKRTAPTDMESARRSTRSKRAP